MLSVLRIVKNCFAPFLHQVTAEAVGTEALFLIKMNIYRYLKNNARLFRSSFPAFLHHRRR